jgi:hypothetical protein
MAGPLTPSRQALPDPCEENHAGGFEGPATMSYGEGQSKRLGVMGSTHDHGDPDPPFKGALEKNKRSEV